MGKNKERDRLKRQEAYRNKQQRDHLLHYLVPGSLAAGLIIGGLIVMDKLGIGSVLANEGQMSPQTLEANRQFAATLENYLQIDPYWDDDKLIPAVWSKYTDPNWIAKNVPLATFKNNQGETMVFGVGGEKGEPMIFNLASKRVDLSPLPLPDTIKIFPLNKETLAKSQFDITAQRLDLIILYAPAETAKRLSLSEDLINKFAQDYFKRSRANLNVLHLYFGPSDYVPQLVDVGQVGKRHSPIVGGYGNASALRKVEAPPGKLGDLARQDVYISLDAVRKISAVMGVNADVSLRIALGDEIAGVWAINGEISGGWPDNEAVTALIGYASGFDDNFANGVLGPNYGQFVEVISDELNRLGK